MNHRSLWFTGSIRIELAAPVSTLALNAVGLEVLGTEPAGPVEANPAAEEFRVTSASPTARWTVQFRGRASEQGLLGLYRSRYGAQHILTTQCAATAARNIFPCIDRPDRRAVIHLRLTVDASVEAIFNTPPRSTTEVDGRTTIEFEPTPAMATYLLYLGIGHFDWFEGPPVHPRIRGAAPPGRAGEARYSVERAAEILPALARYFQIPYPLPKLDLVAVPEFAYGAMENWGAIAFRDMRLLVDPTTSVSQRRATLSTIAHEIAHQWFGNLVTMQWWTDIWLNESFATFTEEKVLEALWPESRPLDDLLIDWTGPAKTGDSLPSTHPVSVPVERPEEIGQIFDEISYGKGSAVLRMVERYVGEAPFRAGVSAYLSAHAYGNATSDDLWSALERSTGRSLRSVLAAWITRPGLPIVRAHLDGPSIRLTQQRFRFDGGPSTDQWPIPLALPDGVGGDRPLWDGPGEFVVADGGGPPRLNVRAAGFYRVDYDTALFERMVGGFPALPPEERWGFAQDLAAFLLSGDAAPERYYRFLDAARSEADPLVVIEIASQLAATSPGRSLLVLGALVGDRERFRRPAAAFLSAQMDRLGFAARPGEPELEPVARGAVASASVPFDAALRAELAGRFPDYDRLDPDLRWPTLFAVASLGAEPEFDRLLKALANAPNEGEALRIERALARFPQPHLIARALELATTPVFNRAHLPSVVREAALNPAGRSVTWEWVRTTLPQKEDDYRGSSIVGRSLEYALPYVGLGRALEVRRALAARPFKEGERGTLKGLEILELYERLLRAVDGASPAARS